MNSPQINEVMKALSKSQKEFPPIPKTKTGRTGNQEYKYADLGDILNIVRPVLESNGLAISQPVGQEIETILCHLESGQFLSSKIPLNMASNIKEIGAEITYLRRYAVIGVLGIITEEDTDAHNERKKQPAQVEIKKKNLYKVEPPSEKDGITNTGGMFTFGSHPRKKFTELEPHQIIAQIDNFEEEIQPNGKPGFWVGKRYPHRLKEVEEAKFYLESLNQMDFEEDVK